MTADHDFERRIADHYAAEAPAKAPGWVLERVLASVEDTPQRRTVFGRPPRIRIMPSTFARLGVAAVAVAAISLIGLTLVRQPAVGPTSSAPALPLPSASPGSSPAPTGRPSPSGGFSRFDSTINGISIDHWSGWQTRPATEAWTGGPLDFDSPAADVIFEPTLGKDLYLLVASQSFSGMSEDAWRASVLGWTCPEGRGGGEMWGWRVDGAYSWQQGPCNSGSIIATDSRGYLIRLVVSSAVPGLADRYDWDWLKTVLATVDLRPEDAIDPPGAGAPVPRCADIAAGAKYSNRFGTPKLAATVPAGGQSSWHGNRDDFQLGLGSVCPFGEPVTISASMVDAVIDDACSPWTRSPVPFRTPAGAAEAIVAQPGHRTSQPTEVTIAGHAALRLEISTKGTTCTDGIGLWYGNEIGLDRDAIVYLVDIDGETLGITLLYDRSLTTSAQVGEAEAIIDSIQIQP